MILERVNIFEFSAFGICFQKSLSSIISADIDDSLSPRNEKKVLYLYISIEFDKKWKNNDRKWIQKAEIGFLFGDLISRDLVKAKGSDFTRKYKLRNLSGLARLSLPQKFTLLVTQTLAAVEVEFRVDRSEDWQASLLHLQRSKDLAKAALKHVNNIV